MRIVNFFSITPAFDVAGGWAALEDVSDAMNLSTVLINELASKLAKGSVALTSDGRVLPL